MRLTTRSVMAALAFVLMGTTLAYAQAKKSVAQPLTVSSSTVTSSSDQLVILSTTVNRVSQTLTVQGLAFGNQPPQVWLETQPLTLISATSTQLVAFLPAAVPDGTYLLTVQRGTAEKDRDVFNMHVGTPGQGPAGPEGPQGPAGPKGDTGAAGPKGDTGATGAQGEAGPAGPKGETGAAGPAGPQGEVGPAGPKGETGAAGPAGPQGATGAPGPQGPQGDVGPTGATGPQGATGVQGPKGDKGDPGVSGYQIVSTGLLTFNLSPGQMTTMSAACPTGRRVLGGGYETVGSVAIHPVASYPPTTDAWKVTLRLSQDTGATIQFRVYAVCASVIN